MRSFLTTTKVSFWPLLVSISMVLVAGCAIEGLRYDTDTNVSLAGAQEVPAVTTSARGSGAIMVGSDKSVSGRVATYGIVSMVAHIHVGAPGVNGPIIIPLTRIVDDVWSVPAGAKLTDAQYESYKAGNLYVNVHTAAHKGGEIRGHLKP